ncbi:cytochrome p450 alkane [Colletotrichum camelliae]|nr:cytochrome p450 alkane [Colletotrichum camelliae]
MLTGNSAHPQRDTAYGYKHGYKPPIMIHNRWPLGIDRMWQLWEADGRKQLLKTIFEVAEEFPQGVISQFFLFGPRSHNILAPQNIEAILSSNFSDYSFGPRAEIFHQLIGDGIFVQEGAAWKKSRAMLRKHLFSSSATYGLEQLAEHIENFLARLPLSEQGGVVDLQPLIFDLFMDNSSARLLGRSTYTLKFGDDTPESTRNRKFAENFCIASEGLVRRFRCVPFHNMYDPARFRTACVEVRHYVEDFLAEVRSLKPAMVGGRAADSLIDQMAQDRMSDDSIRDHVINVLLAGRDSTASALIWTFRLLARTPRVIEKLRNEIGKVMGERALASKAELREMPYLAQVIKECKYLFSCAALLAFVAII